MNDLTRWDGKAWRANEPLQHDRHTTVADVVAYEVEELGNVDSIVATRDALEMFGHLPARKTIWVTATRADARYYGTPEKLDLHGYVIAIDSQGGYLVLQD